nr:hypothetical protein [uncultured Flavobacterium sp.]
MVCKNIIVFVLLAIILCSCREFKGEKIEINYKEGYVKVLSPGYVIDSLRVYNHINPYYQIALHDKNKGTNIVYFKKVNVDYKVYADSLDYYCTKIPDVDSPEVNIVIRKKGVLDYNNENYKNIEYFSYNQTPCNSSIIDTIVAISPYK